MFSLFFLFFFKLDPVYKEHNLCRTFHLFLSWHQLFQMTHTEIQDPKNSLAVFEQSLGVISCQTSSIHLLINFGY